jgi:phenylalanyl-tRNA synthetase beta chain
MKISYNWLKNYLSSIPSPEHTAALLTAGGLEVENSERVEKVKGGLAGLVVGEVKTCEKHPDADRLSLTTVDVGGPNLLQIVCGAANVAAGLKVIVALEGATLHPVSGEPFVIKKSKIRGRPSEGMICAEDEIGLGHSHAGIMVLKAEAQIGAPAKDYFKLEEDHVFEIGLTPNRVDAASHSGVARDLAALLNAEEGKAIASLVLPDVGAFQEGTGLDVSVEVSDTLACPRYSAVCIRDVEVKESPDWLKERLQSIGIRSINNVVDATNFVLHELGQPLHAFDAAKIAGKKVLVKTCAAGTKFVTLDGVERMLLAEDLMICNASEPMCLAGVFGGASSGVTAQTNTIFLESAFFNAVSIRRSSRHHGLKTDASFRYERGADPDITVYALKRAAMLICELTGGAIASQVMDIYPTPIQPLRIPFAFSNCDKLIGKKIDRQIIIGILSSLGIVIESEGEDALLLSVPPRKVDVTRECDVVEEVLRIYGYNKVEIPLAIHSSISYSSKPDTVKLQQGIAAQLAENGFHEIVCNSLSKGSYYENNADFDAAKCVSLLNPLSSDLDVMRQSLLYSGLEVIAYNQKRKQTDLRLFEFGKTYLRSDSGYHETKHLSLFLCGRKMQEGWNSTQAPVDFYQLKGYVMNVCNRLGVAVTGMSEISDETFSSGLAFESAKKSIVQLGLLCKGVLNQVDVAGSVLYADFNWDHLMKAIAKKDLTFQDISKFPAVRRDLALILDKKIKFRDVEQIAFSYEKNLLKEVTLFDVFEGEKLGADKKSYAVSFNLQDENATLTDKQIEKTMEKLMKAYSDKLGATIRQ